MGFVREYGSERIAFRDAITGVRVTQLTSFPLHSMHFYYEHPSFTDDGGTIILRCHRGPGRDAGWDLFACDADGLNLRQLTDEPDADTFAVACGARAAWYLRGTTLWRVDLDTGERQEICGGPTGLDPFPYWCGCVSRDGRYYFGYGRRKSDGQGVIVRYRTDGSETRELAADPNICHLHASPGGHGVSFGGLDAQGRGVQYGVDYDGSNLRVLPTADLSHFTWVGNERRFLGCGMWPRRIIHVRDDTQPDAKRLPGSTVVVEGSYFSHSGLSYDSDWTIADTNWPNEGIMVVNLRTRQYARLCHPENTGGHPQSAHAHVAFNPDGTRAIYTSDRTGVSQVYVAEVPADFRRRLATPQPDAAAGGRLPDRRFD